MVLTILLPVRPSICLQAYTVAKGSHLSPSVSKHVVVRAPMSKVATCVVSLLVLVVIAVLLFVFEGCVLYLSSC